MHMEVHEVRRDRVCWFLCAFGTALSRSVSLSRDGVVGDYYILTVGINCDKGQLLNSRHIGISKIGYGLTG